MAVWKQLILCVAVLLVGAVLWIGFVPGSRETLARWGFEVPAFAATMPGSSEGAAPRNASGGEGQREDRTATVIAYPAQQGTINDRLSAIGTGEALRSVAVTPFVSGRLVEIRVASGDQVTAGDVIAAMDADAERIAVDRAEIALENAQAALDRSTALLNSRTVTAVAQTEAKLAVENARLELAQAQLALERRSIVAPIGGVVGILPVEIGDYVTSQTQIVTLDDRSELVIDFWVPERFATMISVGAPVSATSVARPGQTFEGEVSALDNRLDAASRTLRVQARIANANDELRAGMSFQVQMRFPGNTYPAVDPLAIQWSTDGSFVWLVIDNKATRMPVRIVQRNTDNVLVEADIPDGRQVVTEGVHALRDGAAVRVANEQQPQPVAATQTQESAQ